MYFSIRRSLISERAFFQVPSLRPLVFHVKVADNLQRGVFTLQNITKNFVMEISPEKSQTMAFL
jgi:hypothetical protein